MFQVTFEEGFTCMDVLYVCLNVCTVCETGSKGGNGPGNGPALLLRVRRKTNFFEEKKLIKTKSGENLAGPGREISARCHL